jgi:lipoic acid synthetase
MNKPDWLTLRAPDAEALDQMKRLLDAGRLHTVCEDADCPNIGECFAGKTCTFMILGNVCTRNCRFCAIVPGRPSAVDPGEPQAVASAARRLGLRHVVVTSVTRDDLADGGAGHFAATIRAVRDEMPEATVEVLIPDFMGNIDSLRRVIDAGPDVINHNVETVPRIYPSVRPQAQYDRSLALLRGIHEFGSGILSKSGLMLGLGETNGEVIEVMEDLRAAHCDILTLGQYLSPSPVHHPVVEYIRPDIFKKLEEIGYDMGFTEVSAGPLVRSSYQAERIFSRTGANKREREANRNHGENRSI